MRHIRDESFVAMSLPLLISFSRNRRLTPASSAHSASVIIERRGALDVQDLVRSRSLISVTELRSLIVETAFSSLGAGLTSWAFNTLSPPEFGGMLKSLGSFPRCLDAVSAIQML
jgi:hypothetical protein